MMLQLCESKRAMSVNATLFHGTTQHVTACRSGFKVVLQWCYSEREMSVHALKALAEVCYTGDTVVS
jgi:hypothetical protein